MSRRWLGPILAVYWLILFAATHLPAPALPSTPVGDKTEHFIAYAILGALLTLWLTLPVRRVAHPALVALLVAIAYGAVDELTQPIVNRHADITDFIADAVGAGLGVAAASIGLYLARRRA